uniref:NADH-ubiquinone oxidoreductase chain 5 n=1 Tax=Janus megamaculatus TaxID=2876199 RepID=A0A8K1TMV6_9HYME|nr:NADH dehydrogenase subunit 5 [Janus megamaculatus]
MLSLYFSFFFFFLSGFIMLVGVYFLLNNSIYMVEWNFISLNSVDFNMLFMFDWMSMLFMSFVFFISSMVLVYSYDYMSGEIFFNRFIMLIFMFVSSMGLMILSPNLLSILLGWDGLGLISYCLVSYYQNVKAYSAGMLTVLMNRLGDTGLMLSLSLTYCLGSWNIILYSSCGGSLIISLICLAGFTKSAQIPFSSWLPAAMAAPTPISSLVHSSTLVTAGVYLMIRFNHLLMVSGVLKEVILWFSVLTMFMAGLSANWEMDLKKIIALSTLSQLGLMVGILSLGGVNQAFFHLLTHAMFKALLFMCAGVIIHSMKNFQDIRYMGGMVYVMPLTLVCFNAANLALMGMPFLSGFYSKDLILEELMFMGGMIWILLMFLISVGLTVSYSIRMFLYSLFGEVKMVSCFSLVDLNYFMNFSMIFMLFMSIFSGKILFNLMFFNFNLIFLPLFMKMFVLTVCFIGGCLGWVLFSFNYLLLNSYYFSLTLMVFNKMWFMFEIFYYSLKMFFKGSGTFMVLNENLWNESLFIKNLMTSFIYYGKKFDFFYIKAFKLVIFLYFYLMLTYFMFL